MARNDTKRQVAAAVLIAAATLSLYLLFFRIQQASHLVVPDANYYASIADTLLESGSLRSSVLEPTSPPRTPQNGIVGVHVLLALGGLKVDQRLLTIVILNYLAHLSAAYPLYRIARAVGLRGVFPQTALLATYIAAYNLHRFNLWPLNDGFFNAGVIWLTYFLLYTRDNRDKPADRRAGARALVACVLTASVLVHFRLQTILIFMAAGLTALVVRETRWGVRAALASFACIGSITLVYGLAVDTDLILRSSQSYVPTLGIPGDAGNGSGFSLPILESLPARATEYLMSTIPYVLGQDLGLPWNILYLPFGVALVATLMIGIRERRTALTFVAMIALVGLAIPMLLFAPRPRYITYLFPFLYLLVVRFRYTRPLGYLFMALALMLSVAKVRYAFDVPQPDMGGLALHMRRHGLVPEGNPLVLAQADQAAYYYPILGSSFGGKLTFDRLLQHGRSLVVGDAPYVNRRLQEVEELMEAHDYRFERRNLAPGYQDEPGNTVVEVYDFSRVPESER